MRVRDLPLPQTESVKPDEPTLGLMEVELLTDDMKSIHRYQLVYVIRNDAIAVHATDMGLADLEPSGPIQIYTTPDGREGVHTVAETREMANQVRREDKRQQFLDIVAEDRDDLVGMYHEQEAMKGTYAKRNRRSVHRLLEAVNATK